MIRFAHDNDISDDKIRENLKTKYEYTNAQIDDLFVRAGIEAPELAEIK